MRQRRGRAPRPALEALEDRCLLSATLVHDIWPGPAGAFFFDHPFPLEVNGQLFFLADDGTHGRELWRSDGTPEGTALVKDIRPGSAGAFGTFPHPSLTNVNGTLFFVATDGDNGVELWKSDGTAEGTVLVKDIRPGSGDGFFNETFTTQGERSHLANGNGTLFFRANDGVVGRELWKSDGTAEGTVLVKDLNPGSAGSTPKDFLYVGGALYFHSTDGGTRGLWRSDGTEGGTVLLRGGQVDRDTLTEINGTLYFSANIGETGYELWKSDGTSAGTVLVKDITPGTGHSWAENLTNVNGTLFFTANAGIHASGLFRSDGTAEGTFEVRGVGPDYALPSLQSHMLAAVNGVLFFMAYTTSLAGPHGTELWKTDGTPEGTVQVRDINPGSSSSSPTDMLNVNGTLYFVATTAASGRELWRSDGTAEGTALVQDIRPGSQDAFMSIPRASLTLVNGRLFFVAHDGSNGFELWGLGVSAPNQPPVLGPISDQTTEEGGTLTFTVTATDPDAGQTLTYSLVSGPTGAGIDPVTGVFTWTPDDGPATISVTVRVTDSASPALSDTRTFSVTVLNAAPTAGVTGPSSGSIGQTLGFTFTATDPSSADQAAGFTYIIDWGDGSPLQTIDAFPGSGSGVLVSHAYAAAGAYMVQVTAIDKDGGAGLTMLAELVMVASVPTGVSDLSWSGGGIVTAASVGAGEAFTIGRTFAVGGEPVGPFTIAYWASLDDIFGNEDDFLLGVELIEGAAPGIHSGSSPPFTIAAAGTYRLFAVLDSDGQIDETNEENNLVMALATLLVTGAADDEEGTE